MPIDVVVFHHALGKTAGVEAFAEHLRAAGHRVVVPDLFSGRRFERVEDGVAHAEALGFEAVIAQGEQAAAEVDGRFAVVGFSLGVMPAQKLAQTRAGVCAAVLCHAAVPLGVFDQRWPAGVALQVHLTADDPWAAEDHEAAQALTADGRGELFVYPGRGHLVADPTSPDHDPEAAAAIGARTLALLGACAGATDGAASE